MLKKDSIVQMRSMKEVFRIIDAKKEEIRHIKKKYRYKEESIDLEIKNAFCANKVTTSMIKYTNGFNHYGLKNAMINNNLIEANCLRCN